MKKTFVISLIFIVCGILGFVCQLLYAYFFGLGKEMDIYFSFLSIPAIITGASGFFIFVFPYFCSNRFS
jgi:peptidoglycan biosynthesis protein MviN/MurJ (putative lipid II flippase)